HPYSDRGRGVVGSGPVVSLRPLVALLSRYPQHGRQAPLDVRLRRSSGGNTNTHRGLTVPNRSATPAGAIGLDRRNHTASGLRVPEGNEHLIERHFVKNRVSRGPQPVRQALGIAAGPLDEIGQAGPAERSQGGP